MAETGESVGALANTHSAKTLILTWLAFIVAKCISDYLSLIDSADILVVDERGLKLFFNRRVRKKQFQTITRNILKLY